MSERPWYLRNLPPARIEACTVYLLRELGYVTLVVQHPDGANAGVFTLHRVEAAKLAARIQQLVDGADGAHDLVEGVFLGGPPTADQLMPK